MTVFGAIADDITGATDLAALLARSGESVVLHLGLPTVPPDPEPALQVIALKIRTAPLKQAVAEALAALHWLQGTGVSRFYWKYCSTFDSTAQGNIGPVAEALMQALGTGQTIYCPAFPENQRRVFMGNLFVGTQPLAESPMKGHPLTPMRDSNLLRLLMPQVQGKVGLADRVAVAAGVGVLRARLAELEAEGVAHVVVDAVENADLATIAAACVDAALLTGGSALAMPLPAIYRAKGLIKAQPQTAALTCVAGSAIVLSGSCSAMTQAQVAAHLPQVASYRLDPMLLAAEGPGTAHDWLAAQDLARGVMIYATAAPDQVRAVQQQLGTERAGELVEAALAALAVQARNQGVRRFVVAGGESSGAVAAALGLTRLTVGREIAPGVPWTYGNSAGQTIAFAAKSGNFGSTGFFADAVSAPGAA